MNKDQHSRTALTAAAARAAHLIVDCEPYIFSDTLAARLLGGQAETLLAYHRLHGDHTVLSSARTQVVLRSRIAEAAVAELGGRGATQYVILGAGLDSYAYRADAQGLVFEVDHPASQQFKRASLAAAGIDEPDHVRYVPVDFEVDEPLTCLGEHGFDSGQPAVIAWLGVSPYLSRDAIAATLRQVGKLAAGSEIVFDYMVVDELRDADGRAYAEAVGAHSAEEGEPWLSAFTPADMAGLLADCGFAASVHLTQAAAVPEQFWQRTDTLKPRSLSMICRART